MTQQNNAIYRFITGVIFCSLFAFNFLDEANNNRHDAYVAKKIRKVSCGKNDQPLINCLSNGFTRMGLFISIPENPLTKFFKKLRAVTMQGDDETLKNIATSIEVDKDFLSKEQLVPTILAFFNDPLFFNDPKKFNFNLVSNSVVYHLRIKDRYIPVPAEDMKALRNNTAAKYTDFERNYRRSQFYPLFAVLAPLSVSFIANILIKSIQFRNNFGLYSTKINANFASCAILIALGGYGLYHWHGVMKKHLKNAKQMYRDAAWAQSLFIQEANFQDGLSS